jgi:hypothetical protein
MTVTYEDMTATCRLCGRQSLYRVALRGFCRDHRAEAIAAQRQCGLMHGVAGRIASQQARWDAVHAKSDTQLLGHQALHSTRRYKKS